MTDNEIIKAFKMHLLDNRDCELCPYGPAYYRCSIILLKDVLDLINRQQGEIEKLEKETQDKERAYNDEFCLRKEWQTKCQELLKDKQTTKSEAVKEFAERLKEYATQGFWESDAYIGVEQIDGLLKEFERKENITYDD